MKLQYFYDKLSRNKYFTNKYIFYNYENDNDLKIFIIIIDNILDEIMISNNIGIRYKEQKILLKVLIFLSKNYELYKVNTMFMYGNYYKNSFHNNLVGPREALVFSLIYRLNTNLGYLDYNSYNICINFIANYYYRLYKCNMDVNNIKKELSSELNFSGKYELSGDGNIDKKYYLGF